jgi:hypothetical protein
MIPTGGYMIYLLTAIGLSPGGSSTVHIYTQTIYGTTQITTNLEECKLCPVFASFTLAFALQMRKKHGKTCQSVNQDGWTQIWTGQWKKEKHVPRLRNEPLFSGCPVSLMTWLS